MRDPLFDALVRSGRMEKLIEDARQFAKRQGRHDDAQFYGIIRNQIFDAQANR